MMDSLFKLKNYRPNLFNPVSVISVLTVLTESKQYSPHGLMEFTTIKERNIQIFKFIL